MISPKQRGEFSTKLISTAHGSYKGDYDNFHTLGIISSILYLKEIKTLLEPSHYESFS